MKTTIVLLIFAALILLGLGADMARNFGRGQSDLMEIQRRLINAVSGVR